MFLIICVATNFLGVKYYGEIEFWFACLKVTMLLGLIIFGIIANVGGIDGGQSIPVWFCTQRKPCIIYGNLENLMLT